ncbi:MAG: Gfo/Idh/MocA family oxidoreductase [Armatimonadota bacterium]|jgi:predicted dehydrogenase
MSELRVGIIGLGLGRRRAAGFAANDAAQVAAVCDIDGDKVKAVLEEHPGATGYADCGDMLKSENLDIVVVATPDWLHLEQALAALESGCHILVEKPMVTTLHDAATLVDAVEKSGLQCIVGQNYRRTPIPALTKQLIEDGALGDVFHIVTDHLANKRGQFARCPWYASAEHPRAALLGTGIHAVDMVRWLGGEVEEAFGYGNHMAYPEFPDDDFTIAVYRLSTGAVGRAVVAYGAIIPPGAGSMRITVYGSKGTVKDGKLFTDEGDGKEWRDLPLPELKDSFWAEVDHFIECIQSATTPIVDVREGARNVAACLAAVEASKTRRPVAPARF